MPNPSCALLLNLVCPSPLAALSPAIKKIQCRKFMSTLRDRQTDRQIERQADRQIARQGERQTDRQTDLAFVREFRLIVPMNSCGCEKIHVHQINVHAV